MTPKTLIQWQRHLREHFDAGRVLADIEMFYSLARWCSTARLHTLANKLVETMKERGFADAEVLHMPADGVTRYGGWVMPIAWSPRAATLDLVAPTHARRRLADYRENPHQLLMFSGPTTETGAIAELLAVSAPPTPSELRRVKGRIVLLANSPTIPVTQRLFDAGAVGVVTDHVIRIPGVKEGKYLDQAVQYHNYSLPPWRVPNGRRGFGFALTPETGRRVRQLLDGGEPVRLRAKVDVEIGDGTIPVITGRVPGRSSQEILFTGHIDEPGANDNASGPAMALEIGRVLLDLNNGRKNPVIERGLRFFFSVEVRGMQALMNERPDLFSNGVLGINLDMVANDPEKVHSVLSVTPNQSALPDYGLPFMCKCLEPLAGYGKHWRVTMGNFDTNDNGMGEPAIGVPTLIVMMCPDAVYHTNLDTPDICSSSAIKHLGTAVGAYTGYMAGAGPEQIRELLDVNYDYSRNTLASLAARLSESGSPDATAHLQYALTRETRRLNGLLRLAQPTEEDPTRRKAADLTDRLAEHAESLDIRLPQPDETTIDEETGYQQQACEVIPLKLFRGHFAFAGLPEKEEWALTQAMGAQGGWAAPGWLQLALAMSTGRRNLLEIHQALRFEGFSVGLDKLLNVFRVLACRDYVRNCAPLQIERALDYPESPVGEGTPLERPATRLRECP